MSKSKRNKTGEITTPFEVVSGKVRVTDPCYDIDTWCAASVENVKNGKWNAYVRKTDQGEWGERCSELFVWHADYEKDEVFGKITYEAKGNDRVLEYKSGGMKSVEISSEIGVDSGQAGVFDSKFYKDDKSIEGVERSGESEIICEDEPWYSICCDKTLGEQGWGTIPYGAISRSGYGDGGYDAFKCLNSKREVVGIRIVFIRI